MLTKFYSFSDVFSHEISAQAKEWPKFESANLTMRRCALAAVRFSIQTFTACDGCVEASSLQICAELFQFEEFCCKQAT